MALTRDGYALVHDGAVIRTFGSLPNLLKLPNGDAVQPGSLGSYGPDGEYKVVECWRDQPSVDSGTKLSAPVQSFDGTKVTVTYTLVARSAEEIAAAAQAAEAQKQARVDGLDTLQFYVAFNHENRIRALESKAPITAAQFRAALKAQL